MSKSSVILFPQSTQRVQEAEFTVIGSILLDSKFSLPLVEPLLTAEDFSSPKAKLAYNAILNLNKTLSPVDLVTVTDELHKSGQLDNAGGPGFLADLSMNVGSAANVEYFAKIVRDDSRRRDYNTKLKNMAIESDQNKIPFHQLLEQHEQIFFEISRNYFLADKSFRQVGDIARDQLEVMEAISNGHLKSKSVKSGLTDIDRISNGFWPGELTYLAARPGIGKSALALNIAYNCRQPVGFFSLEMTEAELAKRQLSFLSGVDGYFLKTMRMNAQQWGLIAEAAGKMVDLPIYIDDKPQLSLQELRSKARQLRAKHRIKLIIVDYLQLMKSTKKRSREEEVAEISSGLKACAKELKIPVLALSQLNREIEKRPKKEPQLSDLRESGSIEQDADQVIFLWSSNQDHPEINFKIAKNRSGRTGSGVLFFDKPLSMFRDYEE